MSKTAHKEQRIRSALSILAGFATLTTAIALLPAVFTRLFAMQFILESEIQTFYLVSGLAFLIAIYFVVFRRSVKEWIALSVLGFTILIGVEFAARLSIVALKPEIRSVMGRLSNYTYPELMAYQGHPFLQFTGTPSVALIGNQALGNLSPFNNYGFPGRDFELVKKPSVVRIAAIGASTTASGYPSLMEQYLSKHYSGPRPVEFEVYKFAHGFYTSAHAVVNFVLNIRDFEPDYIVIHQGWNDKKVRNAATGFRSDYSHALTYFREPSILDRYPMRISALYRAVSYLIKPTPNWAFLEQAVFITDRQRGDHGVSNLDELKPYRRNIKTIIDLAKVDRIRVLLTTQPYNTDPIHKTSATQIAQCNEILYELHRRYPGTLLLDLDELMTQRLNHLFTDAGHVNSEGHALKAEAIGRAILEDMQRGNNSQASVQ